MGVPNEITKDSERQVSSSSSAISMPSTREDSSHLDMDESSASPTPMEQLLAIWKMVVAAWKKFTAYLYDSTVSFVGELFADILSHPRLHDVAVGLVVAAINGFMDQEDIGSKVDKTARQVIYDVEKARETSHAIGKEVVPMVAGFVGGMASSLKPSEFKKRRTRRKTHSDRSKSEMLMMANSAEDFEYEDEDEDEYSPSKKSN
mmetsp:Transcript_11851/g.30056  ORF Transcript_11851/g.30056 Transcript_11851/m.30056 type:complete len:204 (+) Transcript_11851:170-781(+)